MKKLLILFLVLLLAFTFIACGRQKAGNVENNNPKTESIIIDSETGESLSARDFENAYELGKSFLNDYYLQKAGKSKIDFTKYIINENLLKYSNKRVSDETFKYDIKEVIIGVYETKLIKNGTCFYLLYNPNIKINNDGSFTEGIEMLISNINGKLVISDWYIAKGSGSSSFDQKNRPNTTIDSPEIWDDQEYVKAIFNKAGI